MIEYSFFGHSHPILPSCRDVDIQYAEVLSRSGGTAITRVYSNGKHQFPTANLQNTMISHVLYNKIPNSFSRLGPECYVAWCTHTRCTRSTRRIRICSTACAGLIRGHTSSGYQKASPVHILHTARFQKKKKKTKNRRFASGKSWLSFHLTPRASGMTASTSWRFPEPVFVLYSDT